MIEPLKWSDDRPAKPGWYFWRYDRRSGIGCVRVVKMKGCELWVDGQDLGTGPVSTWPKSSQWAGPIGEPE